MEQGTISSQEVVDRVREALEDMKGDDILVIEIREISSIADFIVIVSGGVSRKVIAMADAVYDVLRKSYSTGEKPKIEGKAQGDWVVVDGGEVVVHLQRTEVRAYYRIEDIWLGRTKKTDAIVDCE